MAHCPRPAVESSLSTNNAVRVPRVCSLYCSLCQVQYIREHFLTGEPPLWKHDQVLKEWTPSSAWETKSGLKWAHNDFNYPLR